MSKRGRAITKEELRKKKYYYDRSSSFEFVRKGYKGNGELIDGEFERVKTEQARIGQVDRIDPATACEFQRGPEGERGPVGERGLEGVRGPRIDPELLASIMAQVEAARPDQRSLKQKHPKLWYIPEAMLVISVVMFVIVLLIEIFK